MILIALFGFSLGLIVVEDLSSLDLETVSDSVTNYCRREMTVNRREKEWTSVGASACPGFSLEKFVPSWMRRGFLEVDTYTYQLDTDDCGYQTKFISAAASVSEFGASLFKIDMYYDKVVMFKDDLSSILHTFNLGNCNFGSFETNGVVTEHNANGGGKIWQVKSECVLQGDFKVVFYSYVSNKEIQGKDHGIYFTPNSIKSTIVLENIDWNGYANATGIGILGVINKADVSLTASPTGLPITVNYSRPDEALSDQDLLNLRDGGFFSFKKDAFTSNGDTEVIFSVGESDPDSGHCPQENDWKGFKRVHFTFDTTSKPSKIAWDPSIGKEDDGMESLGGKWAVINTMLLISVIICLF